MAVSAGALLATLIPAAVVFAYNYIGDKSILSGNSIDSQSNFTSNDTEDSLQLLNETSTRLLRSNEEHFELFSGPVLPSCCNLKVSGDNQFVHHCSNGGNDNSKGKKLSKSSIWDVPGHLFVSKENLKFKLEKNVPQCKSGNFTGRLSLNSSNPTHGFDHFLLDGFLKLKQEYYRPDEYCINGFKDKQVEIMICKPDCEDSDTPCIQKCCGMNEIYSLGIGGSKGGCVPVDDSHKASSDNAWSPTFYHDISKKLLEYQIEDLRPHIIQKNPSSFKSQCSTKRHMVYPYGTKVSEYLGNVLRRPFPNLEFRLRKDGWLMHPNASQEIAISTKTRTVNYCIDGVKNYGESEPFSNKETESVLFLCEGGPEENPQTTEKTMRVTTSVSKSVISSTTTSRSVSKSPETTTTTKKPTTIITTKKSVSTTTTTTKGPTTTTKTTTTTKPTTTTAKPTTTTTTTTKPTTTTTTTATTKPTTTTTTTTTTKPTTTTTTTTTTTKPTTTTTAKPITTTTTEPTTTTLKPTTTTTTTPEPTTTTTTTEPTTTTRAPTTTSTTRPKKFKSTTQSPTTTSSATTKDTLVTAMTASLFPAMKIPVLPTCCEINPLADEEDEISHYCRTNSPLDVNKNANRTSLWMAAPSFMYTNKISMFRLKATPLACKNQWTKAFIQNFNKPGINGNGKNPVFMSDGGLKYKNEYFSPKEYCINGIYSSLVEVLLCKADCSSPDTPCIQKCCGPNQIYSLGAGKTKRGCVPIEPSDERWRPVLYNDMNNKVTDEELTKMRPHVIQKFPPKFQYNCFKNITLVFPFSKEVVPLMSPLAQVNLEFRLRKDGKVIYRHPNLRNLNGGLMESVFNTPEFCVDGIRNYGENEAPFANRPNQTILFVCALKPSIIMK